MSFGDVNEDDRDETLSAEQLQAQLAAEREARSRSDDDLQRERERFDQFLRGQNTPTPKPTPAEQLGPMPDLVTQPEEYQRWVLKRDQIRQQEIEDRFERQGSEIRSEITTAESRAVIWQDFQSDYPDHARRRDLAGVAFNSLQSTGKLPKGRNEITKAIKVEMERLAGGSLDQVSPPPDRTSGVSAGERPAPPKPSRQAYEEGDNVTLHDAASAFKEKHGLI